jgi:predicted alpha/beta superfamily hydrolase
MHRRSFDLTPPPQPTTTAAAAAAGYGGADIFLDFIEETVKPAVKARFPRVNVTREALFGHSYGGLFALHALFTRPGLFDCYIASSPSIWWNDRFIEHEAISFLLKYDTESPSRPSLMVFCGSLEQDAPSRTAHESVDDYEARKKVWLDLRMVDNVRSLCDRLRGCERLHNVLAHEFQGEEHTSVMACSMNRGLTMFFESWPL